MIVGKIPGRQPGLPSGQNDLHLHAGPASAEKTDVTEVKDGLKIWIYLWVYPLVNVAMENHYFLWEHPLLMAIFNNYVKLPEGNTFMRFLFGI